MFPDILGLQAGFQDSTQYSHPVKPKFICNNVTEAKITVYIFLKDYSSFDFVSSEKAYVKVRCRFIMNFIQ